MNALDFARQIGLCAATVQHRDVVAPTVEQTREAPADEPRPTEH